MHTPDEDENEVVGLSTRQNKPKTVGIRQQYDGALQHCDNRDLCKHTGEKKPHGIGLGKKKLKLTAGLTDKIFCFILPAISLMLLAPLGGFRLKLLNEKSPSSAAS